ncbi:MAG: hypothetical protein ABIP20_14990 [Chthoniobacteraceae bacterium]
MLTEVLNEPHGVAFAMAALRTQISPTIGTAKRALAFVSLGLSLRSSKWNG